jgi:hypothetical protein
MLGPKVPIWRSEPYRRYVGAQECFGCGIQGFSQCAHPNNGKGFSLKTDDWLTFPLCCVRIGHMGCHNQHDLCWDMTRDQRREAEAKYTAKMQERARLDGWSPGASGNVPKRSNQVARKSLFKEST